jgi:transcriptional regulator with XRE-family HTH domain
VGFALANEGKPGALLKALRLQKRLTLAEVSHRTGLPVSTISKVENDKMSLSYDKLQAISTGLGIDVGVLFKPAAKSTVESTSGRRSILRIGDGRRVETHLTSYLHLAGDLLNKRFIPLLCEIRARSLDSYSEMIRHPGEEYTYVLEGALELHSELYAPVQLHAGESIYFDSGMPHAYIAISKGPCKVLTICSSTEAQLFEAVDRSRPKNPPDEAPSPVRPKKVRPPARKSRSTVHGKPKS